MHDVTMPKLSDSMQVGKIVKWRVKPGDAVQEGDILAEVESDKAVMELECFRAGVVAELVQPEGAEAQVGSVIARIGAKSEAPAKAEKKPAAPPGPPPAAKTLEEEPAKVKPQEKPAGRKEQRAPKPPAPAKKAAAQPPEEAEEPSEERVEEVPETTSAEPSAALRPGPSAAPGGGRPALRPKKAPPGGRAKAEEAGRLRASPYARRLAEEMGVDLAQIKGTGPDGRIVAADVEAAGKGRAKADQESPAAEAAAGKMRKPAEGKPEPALRYQPPDELPPLELAEGEADVTDASFRQRTQAAWVMASKRVIPHFYVTRPADVTALYARKDEIKRKFGATLTHVVAFACLKALAEHPEVNRSFDRGRIIAWRNVNLGLAVDTPEGLTVAVAAKAQGLSLKELAERINALVERSRQGKLSPEDRRHPTFTISNLGMFEVEQFEAIIAPPSAITLAVASALPAVIVRDGAIHIGRQMKLTVSCDHRIVDGVTAARFLQTLCRMIESPELVK